MSKIAYTIWLSRDDHKKLIWLSRRFNMTKHELVSALITAKYSITNTIDSLVKEAKKLQRTEKTYKVEVSYIENNK